MPADFVALVSSVSDIAFVTDRDGKILDVIWQVEAKQAFDPDSLIGLTLFEIVTLESRPKIEQMLKADGPAEGGRHREINHRIEGLDEFPVRYNAVGAGDSVIFLGHEIRAIAALQSRLIEAQRALDEDYSRLRQMETQYRVLFQTSSECLVVVNAASRKVEDANSAAAQLMGGDVATVKGQTIDALFDTSDTTGIMEAVNRVSASGQADGFAARVKETKIAVRCNLSIFRAAATNMILCAITPDDQLSQSAGGVEKHLLEMVERIPDALVLTDEEGLIRWCNEAFLGMAEIALAPQAQGEALARFLGRPGVDMDIIIQNAQSHGRLRAFSSLLTGAFGSEIRVEVSVAAIVDPEPLIGFVLRDISRYDQIPARKNEGATEVNSDLVELVGTVPMKELVRASTEEIEKMCIEAALKKTGNNRASAAEMLGLSRQSLYVKLRRFDLLDRDGN
ncbi:MAG: transcriptional regulator PpsR [Pseudomonadota bacterium]